jgi:hypothetical protein
VRTSSLPRRRSRQIAVKASRPFAAQVALIADDLHLDELLRDRASAFSDAAGDPIRLRCPCDTPRIYPPVAIEAPILDAENAFTSVSGKSRRLTASLSGPTRPSACPFAASTNTDGPSMPTRFSRGM